MQLVGSFVQQPVSGCRRLVVVGSTHPREFRHIYPLLP